MADVFNFYVRDDRKMDFHSPEPIMQEDKDVAVWKFRIPKALNQIDMSNWAWWFVYVNAKGQKFSKELMLSPDYDEPGIYNSAEISIDHGISIYPGNFTFALEAIEASVGGGTISGEWHTYTYTHKVIGTLQGNQAEYVETQSDIISALIVQIQQKYNALTGGATPQVVGAVSDMTDTSKIYVLSTDGNWYWYNGSAWVSGGQYASGITIDSTLTQSGEAADAKETGDRFDDAKSDLNYVVALDGDTTGADYSPWTSGKTVLNTGKIGTSATNSACSQFIRIPDYATLTMITGTYPALIALYSDDDENTFLSRTQYSANTSHVVDTTGARYARIAFGSLDTTEANTVRLVFDYGLKAKIDEITTDIINAVTTDFSNATAIPANTDYNNLTTAGNYFCSTAANAQSMINCPTTMGHRLTVLTTTAASHALQIINANDAERSIYIRESTDSKWNKIATSYNTVETQSSVITGDNYASVLPDADTAEVNTIYTINGNVPVQNLPDGNLNVAGDSDTSGLPGGTLITYKGGTSSGNSAKVQIFISAGGLENVTYGIMCVRYCRYTLGSFVWTDWSKFGNGINLRATNVQIQESRIQAGTALFSDMNDAPNNSIAQIDLDAVSMAHNPLSGHSCVLVTMSSSYISRHGQIQLCVGIDAGVKAYIRYGYQQAANDNRWTNWHQISLTDLGT